MPHLFSTDGKAIIARWNDQPDLGANRIYHFAGQGEVSWADMARQLFPASAKLGGPSARVNDITTEQYPTPARRPANSRLDGTDIQQTFNSRPAD